MSKHRLFKAGSLPIAPGDVFGRSCLFLRVRDMQDISLRYRVYVPLPILFYTFLLCTMLYIEVFITLHFSGVAPDIFECMLVYIWKMS